MIPTREQAWVWYNKTQDDKDWFQSFAALAAQWGAEQEREACAKMCEEGLPIATSLNALDDMELWGERFAAAIRHRGEAKP